MTRRAQVPARVDWPLGGGEMGAAMRATNWSATALGPTDRWPPSLCTLVSVVLGSRFPMLLWWGPELLHVYNDAYRPMLRDKHPASLGAPAAQVWADVWNVTGPLAKGVQAGGPPTWTEDLQLFLSNGRMSEEVYFTFSLSPVPGDDGHVGGVLKTAQETTAKVQGERQLRLLHQLATRGADVRSEAEARRVIAEALESNPLDLPFAHLYRVEEQSTSPRWVAGSGWRPSAKAARWPFAQALAADGEVIVDNLPARFGDLPMGRWNRQPQQALVLPLRSGDQPSPRALLVAGVSPHRVFDERYRQFFGALGQQIAAVLASADRAEAEQRQVYESLAREREAAELAIRELESFSYSVAHDLRAPLRGIDGFSQALIEDCADQLGPSAMKHLRFVRESAQHMAQLIDDLLALSRVARGELHRERVDLSALARASLARLQRGDPTRHVQAAVADGLSASGDTRMLTVLLDQLLGNAWKFTRPRPKATIELGATTTDGRTAYFVRDNGVGFDPGFANKLFGVFQRLHGATEFEGTGIGLAMVQRVVSRHRGRVWAEGAVDQGATFWFTLYEKDQRP